MSTTYPNLIRNELYARWRLVLGHVDDPDPMATAQRLVINDLRAWLHTNRLRRADDVIELHVARSHFGPDRPVIVAECRALGIPPEERILTGWRGLVRMG